MFSKAIFKQTLKSNWKLWAIFTAIMCVMSTMIIAVFDPKMISSMMDMMKDMPMADMMGDQLNGMTSLLGMLGESFYGMMGVILPLIFIIITANSLIASQVDRGSMAYLLSTPTKRSKVVRTQALYMITSVLTMFLVLTIVGLSSVQIFQGGVFTKAYTSDVKAVATLLDKDEADIADDLNLILNDKDALLKGAETREIEEDVYEAYLNLKIADNAYVAAAEIMDVDADEVRDNPAMIKDNTDALTAAAKVMGMETAKYGAYLDTVTEPESSDQSTEMQEKLLEGINAAADVLNKEAADLFSDMGSIKSSESALNAAVDASGMPKEMFISIINSQLANDELTLDNGIEFSVKDFLMLNLGAFLLMFALSAISFMFSCIFNLSKNSLALGAGIPIAFFIFQIMAQVGESLENFKYISLNTLFDPNAITTGGSFWVQFVVLGAVGVVLYSVGMKVFKEKDLPL